MDQMAKDVVSIHHMAAAQITIIQPVDQISKTATVNTHHTDAVLITRHQPEDRKMLDVDVNMRNMAVAQTKFHQLKDRNWKDAVVTHINLDVAQMGLQFNKDHTVMDAIAHRPNSNAVPMELQQRLVQTLPDVRVQPANMDVVRMVSPMHNQHNSMDVMMFQQLHHKRHVALQRMPVPAAIIPLNSSSIWNMVAAHDSGTVVAVAMKIASKRMKSVKAHALHQLAKMRAKCQRFMAHALDIIRNSITIPIETFAHHSFMVDVWATPTDSKQWKNVNNNVSLIKICVSI